MSEGQRYAGTITEWRDEQGYGFAVPNGGGDRVFVHIKDMASRRRRPETGDRINYRLAMDDRGRSRAVKVEYASGPPRRSSRRGSNAILVGFAGLFLAAIAALVMASRMPPIVLLTYLTMSALAFAFYALDKSAAVHGRWRTRESTLIVLGLLGGWPGALLAQQWLRHKSSKKAFQLDYWLSVIVNLCVAGWLLTKPGSRAAQQLQDALIALLR